MGTAAPAGSVSHTSQGQGKGPVSHQPAVAAGAGCFASTAVASMTKGTASANTHTWQASRGAAHTGQRRPTQSSLRSGWPGPGNTMVPHGRSPGEPGQP